MFVMFNVHRSGGSVFAELKALHKPPESDNSVPIMLELMY